MEDIYTWAEAVYIWLGPSTATSDGTMRILQRASKYWRIPVGNPWHGGGWPASLFQDGLRYLGWAMWMRMWGLSDTKQIFLFYVYFSLKTRKADRFYSPFKDRPEILSERLDCAAGILTWSIPVTFFPSVLLLFFSWVQDPGPFLVIIVAGSSTMWHQLLVWLCWLCGPIFQSNDSKRLEQYGLSRCEVLGVPHFV